MLRYRRLPVDSFAGTLDTGIISHRGNRYAQVYAHRNTWCKAYPMAKKSDTHETLSLMFAQEVVISTLIMYGVREQVMGEFRHKPRQAHCHVYAKWVLGRWLGPSTDIGPALCANILKENGKCEVIIQALN